MKKNSLLYLLILGIILLSLLYIQKTKEITQNNESYLTDSNGINGQLYELYELAYASQQQYNSLFKTYLSITLTSLDGKIENLSNLASRQEAMTFLFFEEGHCDQCLDLQFNLIKKRFQQKNIVLVGVFDRLINFKAYIKRKGLEDLSNKIYLSNRHLSDKLGDMKISYYLTLDQKLRCTVTHIPMKEFVEITEAYLLSINDI